MLRLRFYHIIIGLFIVFCFVVLYKEYKPYREPTKNSNIISNTFKYYKMLDDEATQKTTKDTRYIEAN